MMYLRVLARALALGLFASLLVVGGSAGAEVTVDWRTSAPTTEVKRVVPRGGTIKVTVRTRGSKVIKSTRSLWRDGRRVWDWSPKPGRYRTKTVITWRPRIYLSGDEWVPDADCESYSDPEYDACAEDEYGYWDWVEIVKLGDRRTVTRWNDVRVHTDESPGCVSGAEHRAVRDGMTMARVHGIYGTRGREAYRGSGGIGREYATCSGDPDWSYASVDYDWRNGAHRVWFKWIYISW